MDEWQTAIDFQNPLWNVMVTCGRSWSSTPPACSHASIASRASCNDALRAAMFVAQKLCTEACIISVMMGELTYYNQWLITNGLTATPFPFLYTDSSVRHASLCQDTASVLACRPCLHSQPGRKLCLSYRLALDWKASPGNATRKFMPHESAFQRIIMRKGTEMQCVDSQGSSHQHAQLGPGRLE